MTWAAAFDRARPSLEENALTVLSTRNLRLVGTGLLGALAVSLAGATVAQEPLGFAKSDVVLLGRTFHRTPAGMEPTDRFVVKAGISNI